MEIYFQDRLETTKGQISYKMVPTYFDKQTYRWELTFLWQRWDGLSGSIWFSIFTLYAYVRRPRGDIERKKYNGNIPYVRDNDPVRTQSLSRTYAIMIPYVRNNDPVRTLS